MMRLLLITAAFLVTACGTTPVTPDSDASGSGATSGTTVASGASSAADVQSSTRTATTPSTIEPGASLTTDDPGRPSTDSITTQGVQWEDGSVSSDGLRLTLHIWGRPASPEGDPCTTSYTAEVAAETPTAITVRITGRSPPVDPAHVHPCPLVLAQHTLSLRLGAPLNGRAVEVLGEVRSLAVHSAELPLGSHVTAPQTSA